VGLQGQQKRSVDLRAAWAAVLGIQFPLRLFDRALVTTSVSDAALVLAMARGFLRQEWRQWLDLRRDSVSRWIAGFSALLLVGLLVSRLRLGHWSWWGLINRGLGLVMLLSIYCIFATVATQRVWRYLQWFVISGSLLNLPALVAVAVRYGLNHGSVFIFSYSSLRLSGLMHHPNAYGGFLAVLLSVQLGALAFGRQIFPRRWLDWANVAALIAAAVFTISRSSWIAVFAGALTVLALTAAAPNTTHRRHRDLAPAAAVAAASLGLLLMAGGGGLAALARDGVAVHTTIDSSWIYFPHGSPSFAEFLRVARDPAGAGDRLAIDQTALELYSASASRLTFGLGLGSFEDMSSSTRLRTAVVIHNSFLWALVELGPLGAVCLLAVFAKTFRRLWNAIRSDAGDRPTLAGLFAGLVACAVWCLGNEGVFQRQLWFLLGLSVAATASAVLPLRSPAIVSETVA